MKNTLLLILLIFAFSSCNKSYKYVETVKEKSLFSNSYNEKEEEPKTISSKNDSLAYLEAYQKFCISQKVYKDMTNQGIEFVNIPIKFSLYNSNGEKVNPYINQSTLDNIKNNVMSLDDNIGKTISDIKKELILRKHT
jgi:predicted choloylglycine hydrolase